MMVTLCYSCRNDNDGDDESDSHTSITSMYHLYLQYQLHGLYICHSSPRPTSDFSSNGSISIDSIPLHR